jgi:hypothetical protein
VLGAALVGVFTHIPVVALLLGYGDYLADLEAQIIFVGGRVVVDGLDFVHGDGLQWWMQSFQLQDAQWGVTAAVPA